MFWTSLNCSSTSRVPLVSPCVLAGELVNLTTVSSAVAVYHRTPDRRKRKNANSRKMKLADFLRILYNWRNFHELQNQAVFQGLKLDRNVSTTQGTFSVMQGLFQDLYAIQKLF